MIRRTCATAAVTLLMTVAAAGAVQAQTFQGRVLDSEERPIPTALVRLLDEQGGQRGMGIADREGFYEVEAPGPGTYRLEVARLGYENFTSATLNATSRGGLYSVNLSMKPAPIAVVGLRVETRRAVDRQIRLALGVNPSSLRNGPMELEAIQDHANKSRNLAAALQWTSRLRVDVRQTTSGPCFSQRGQDCMPVYLDGLRLNRALLDTLPLDMVYTIVVVTPTDGVNAYPGGAVLLYTEAWVR